MIQKQRELQQMRQSIAELKQLQLSVQQLLVAEPPAPAGGLASRPHTDPTPPAAAPPPAAAARTAPQPAAARPVGEEEGEEEALLAELAFKHESLRQMRAFAAPPPPPPPLPPSSLSTRRVPHISPYLPISPHISLTFHTTCPS